MEGRAGRKSRKSKYKDQSKIAELERLLGPAHAAIDLFKKSVRHEPEKGPGEETETNSMRRYMFIQEAHSSSLKFF